jgi:predicted metal-dependent phosphoesterase TrpH
VTGGGPAPDDHLKVDLHLHSGYSHDSAASLESLISRSRELGLARIALTDHDTAEGALELARLAPELAIIGEEVMTTEGEVIGLFITGTIESGDTPEEVMDQIHAMGGLTYLAHPLDRHRSSFRPERIVELAPRTDIIETYNSWCRPEDNQAAASLASELGLVGATGTDAHAARELGHCWMEIEPYESVAGFLDSLRRARHIITPRAEGARRA